MAELRVEDSCVSCLVGEVDNCDNEAATVELKPGMPSGDGEETSLVDRLVGEEDNWSDEPPVVRLGVVVTTGEALPVAVVLLLP